jgi:hypothetical protein
MQKYLFVLEHGTIEYIPYFSYQDISKMWFDGGGGSRPVMGFRKGSYGRVLRRGNTPEDRWWNYIMMISGMLLQWQGRGKLGTGNSDLDNKLANDFVIAKIYILYGRAYRYKASSIKFLKRRKLVASYKDTKGLVSSCSTGDNAWLTKKDVQRIEPIFQIIEKKLAL